MVIKPSPAMKTPNAMLMAASMGSALFIVKVAVVDTEGDVGTGAYIAVTTVGLGNWVRRSERPPWRGMWWLSMYWAALRTPV
jgi:hypothetical protein